MGNRNRKKVFENLEIIDAGAKGKAVAKAPDGKIVFAPYAVPGDVATIETYKKRKGYYEGKVVSFQKYSDKRTDPICEHFGLCGGCKWQNMAYQHQLFYKQKEVVNNLQRLGGISLPEITPILGSQNPYYYRNKMEFSFSNNKWLTKDQIESDTVIENRNALGFHIPGMWDKILDIEECHLQAPPSNAIRNFIKQTATEMGLSFFNPRKQEGFLRTLMIRNSIIGEIMVLLQFFYEDTQNREQLLESIKNEFPEITSLLYVINKKGNDTIYDQEVHCYAGRDYILEEMEGLQFKVNAKSFYQTNSAQAYALYKVAREFAGLTGKELVYDLYTGTGTIAQFIAKGAKEVIGIDVVPEAIEAAKENASLNNIANVRFFAGDMKALLTEKFTNDHGHPDLIITDPPREGMHKDVIDQLLRLQPAKIVYVSCNSATQARDLSLMDHAYKVIKMQPVDMFPQTHHVENVVLLEKR